MSRRYLITGGGGFIGSNFVRHLFLNEPTAQITNLDALTYAGVEATIAQLDQNDAHHFIHGNICDVDLVDRLVQDADVVVHFAAESHVDRSISGPNPFLETNVVGTGVLLDAAVRHGVERFVHISTDEVYGSIDSGFAKESFPLDPSSPYSASKAGADLLALAYHRTYGIDVVVTRCTNNYGPYQFPEKVIPLFITNLVEKKKVPLYGSGMNQRDWLFVTDNCAAVHLLIDKGEAGTAYNIGANAQIANIEVARAILDAFGLDESSIEMVPDRPGHDFRYAVDSTQIRSLGWEPSLPFDEGLAETIEWYRQHPEWWRPLKDLAL